MGSEKCDAVGSRFKLVMRAVHSQFSGTGMP